MSDAATARESSTRNHHPAFHLGTLGPGNFSRLHRESGVSRSAISRYLRGKRGASIQTQERIAEAAGMSVEDIRRFRQWYRDRRRGQAQDEQRTVELQSRTTRRARRY